VSAPAAGLLAGRTVVVTGAGGGVGAGIAEACAAHGASVVIAARRVETGEPVAERIAAAGGRAVCIRCDVAVRDDVDAAVDLAVSRFGGLDAMVHNALAPVGSPVQIQDVPDDTWEAMKATAVRASFHCAQASFPHLREREGTLLLISSATGVEASPFLPAYGVVKAVQRGLAKSLAREWGPFGIRVNCIGPVAMTPAMERVYTLNPVLEERLTGRTPLGRIGDPATDIGPVAVFLISDLSRYMTGQTLMVDGGGFMGF